MTGQEIPAPGATESVIRVLMLIDTERRKQDLKYVYLKGAHGLRAPADE